MGESVKEKLLEKKYVEQFNVEKFTLMIRTYISLIRTMQLELGDVNSIKITPSYEIRYSNFVQPSSSKIETFILKKYDTETKLHECISNFQIAVNYLSRTEREWFVKYFLSDEKSTCISLRDDTVDLSPRDSTNLRKSAIVKFAVSLKFHRLDINLN